MYILFIKKIVYHSKNLFDVLISCCSLILNYSYRYNTDLRLMKDLIGDI